MISSSLDTRTVPVVRPTRRPLDRRSTPRLALLFLGAKLSDRFQSCSLALDDTTTKHYGPQIQGAGVHHNPTPGPAGSLLRPRAARQPQGMGHSRPAAAGPTFNHFVPIAGIQ